MTSFPETAPIYPDDSELLPQLRIRLAIADALAWFCECIDAADYASCVQVFTPDCVTDYGSSSDGVLHGRDRFLVRVKASQSRFIQTHHQLGQIRYVFGTDSADTVAYATAAHRFRDGSRMDSRIQYHDHWVQAGGLWLISRRRTLRALVDGKHQDGDNWVPRGAGLT